MSEPVTTKKCPHCQEEIAKAAKKCPKCQSDLRSWFNRHPIWTVILLLFLSGSVMNALQEQNGGTTSSSGLQAEQSPAVPSRLEEEAKKIKIDGWVEEGTFAPDAVLKITNNTGHPIDLFAFSAQLFNNADELQRAQISGNTEYGGQSQETLAAGKTATWRWQLSLYPHATKIGFIKVTKIHYKDTGETIQ